MEFGTMAQELMGGKNEALLRKLAESGENAQLAARFDGSAAEAALRSGDEGKLRDVLKSVLSTPEGRRLAAKVKEAMDGHGR